MAGTKRSAPSPSGERKSRRLQNLAPSHDLSSSAGEGEVAGEASLAETGAALQPNLAVDVLPAQSGSLQVDPTTVHTLMSHLQEAQRLQAFDASSSSRSQIAAPAAHFPREDPMSDLAQDLTTIANPVATASSADPLVGSSKTASAALSLLEPAQKTVRRRDPFSEEFMRSMGVARARFAAEEAALKRVLEHADLMEEQGELLDQLDQDLVAQENKNEKGKGLAEPSAHRAQDGPSDEQNEQDTAPPQLPEQHQAAHTQTHASQPPAGTSDHTAGPSGDRPEPVTPKKNKGKTTVVFKTPDRPTTGGKSIKPSTSGSGGRGEKGDLRSIPCLGCLKSTLAGKMPDLDDGGGCRDQIPAKKRCWLCASGHTCKPM